MTRSTSPWRHLRGPKAHSPISSTHVGASSTHAVRSSASSTQLESSPNMGASSTHIVRSSASSSHLPASSEHSATPNQSEGAPFDRYDSPTRRLLFTRRDFGDSPKRLADSPPRSKGGFSRTLLFLESQNRTANHAGRGRTQEEPTPPSWMMPGQGGVGGGGVAPSLRFSQELPDSPHRGDEVGVGGVEGGLKRKGRKPVRAVVRLDQRSATVDRCAPPFFPSPASESHECWLHPPAPPSNVTLKATIFNLRFQIRGGKLANSDGFGSISSRNLQTKIV